MRFFKAPAPTPLVLANSSNCVKKLADYEERGRERREWIINGDEREREREKGNKDRRNG